MLPSSHVDSFVEALASSADAATIILSQKAHSVKFSRPVLTTSFDHDALTAIEGPSWPLAAVTGMPVRRHTRPHLGHEVTDRDFGACKVAVPSGPRQSMSLSKDVRNLARVRGSKKFKYLGRLRDVESTGAVGRMVEVISPSIHALLSGNLQGPVVGAFV